MNAKGSIPALRLRHRMLRCVQCGLRADSFANAGSEECPGCGCDLLTRPPRSYAEMEGLYEGPLEAAPVSDGGIQDRLDAAAARWVLLLCGIALGGLGMVVMTFLLSGT